eukprot:8742115-Pyramimonas_sp.AAC.1
MGAQFGCRMPSRCGAPRLFVDGEAETIRSRRGPAKEARPAQGSDRLQHFAFQFGSTIDAR